MPQHDYVIDDQNGANFLADVNDALEALITQNSGTAEPPAPREYMTWPDTTNNLMKRRNAANTGWITAGTLDEFPVLTRSSNTILASRDRTKTIIYTGNHTQTLTAAATLGAGWWVNVVVNSGVTMTFDANSTELIDGTETVSIVGPADGYILCTGSAFKVLGAATVTKKINRVVDFEDLYAEGTTNFVTALGTLATLFNSLGGGAVYFRKRSYTTAFATGAQIAAAFTALDGFDIIGAPSVINSTQTDALNQSATIFDFSSNCKRCSVSGMKLIAEDMAASSFLSSAGQRLIHLQGQNADFATHNVAQEYGLALLQITGTAGATSRTVGVVASGYMHAKGCTYGINAQYNGDGLRVPLLTTEICYRSYFVYGVVDHDVNILSKGARHDDVIIAGLDGQGCQHMRVRNCQIDAPANAGAAQSMISIQYGPATLAPVKMHDIQIHNVGRIGASGGSCGYTYGFRLKKADSAGAADTTDRGHILSDVTVSGNYAAAAGVGTPNAAFVPFLVCDGGVGGTWGSGEFITNFRMVNWYVPFACGASYFTPNAAAVSGSALDDVALPAGDLQLSVAAPGVLCRGLDVLTRTEGTPAVIKYLNCKIAGTSVPDRIRITAQAATFDYDVATGLQSNVHNGNTASVLSARATSTSYAGEIVRVAAASSNMTPGAWYAYSYWNEPAAAYKFLVFNTGTVQNATGSYGAISDARDKHLVVNMPGQLERLLRARMVLYELIAQPGLVLPGVIAQELMDVFPELVERVAKLDKDGNETGDYRLYVNYSHFVPYLIKGMQELHAQLRPVLWLMKPIAWAVSAARSLRLILK